MRIRLAVNEFQVIGRIITAAREPNPAAAGSKEIIYILRGIHRTEFLDFPAMRYQIPKLFKSFTSFCQLHVYFGASFRKVHGGGLVCSDFPSGNGLVLLHAPIYL